ncbi:MAG: amidohydrolase [Treponema sp.]|nr:amidohydrolase [Treponema sp.]
MIKLNEYRPVSRLEIPNEQRLISKFPVIDVHNHLGKTIFTNSQITNQSNLKECDPRAVYESTNRFNIRHMVSLDGWPDERLDQHIDAYVDKYPGRFSIFARIDYKRLEEGGFDKWIDNHLASYTGRGITGIKIAKNLGLGIKKKDGRYLKPDDEILRPVWESAAKYNIPVLIHIADPVAFFDKVIDCTNERYEELDEHPDWSFGNKDCPGFRELLDSQENLLGKNPDTRFIIAHVGSHAENLKDVGRMLDTYPNMYVDTAERIAELGRQPYTSRDFLIKYQDRVLYGTDLVPTTDNISGNYRFFETKDEFFPYNSFEEHNQGRWNIYGVYLDDDVLKKIYYENALKVVPGIRKMLNL